MKRTRGSKKITIEDRMEIRACLHNRMSLGQIALRFGKSESTKCRGLLRNSKASGASTPACPGRKRLLVCNTCRKKACCGAKKRHCDFRFADQLAENRKRTSRSSPKTSQGGIAAIDEAVSSGVRLGQSLHHIYAGNPSLAGACPERTIRRLAYRGFLSVRPRELRRYATYRHEYAKSAEDPRIWDIRSLLGRSFRDYRSSAGAHRRLNVVQFGSAVGMKTDGKAIPAATFPRWNFRFGTLIERGSAESAVNELREGPRRIGPELVGRAFPVRPADNETESSLNGERILRTFNASPHKATDRAECERNHELVRYVLPMGKPLDFLDQAKLDGIFSNINSCVREPKGGRTPYDMAGARFGQGFLDAIGIKKDRQEKKSG
jgi:hypothetical protein